MRIRWLGHSAFEITTDENLKILIDPFIKDNPACPVEVEDLKPDIICITHGHKDHFGDAVALSERNKALIIANHEHSVYLSQQDLETVGMNIGGTIYSHEISITMINSNHSSDMDFTEEITSGGSACGYILELENHKKVYHSGDTGVFGDMKTVIRDIYRPDIAMIPIGDRYTMGPMEAAIAARWIEPQILIPMHYNTFPVIQQNPMEFKKTVELSNTNIKVVVLEPGQIYEE